MAYGYNGGSNFVPLSFTDPEAYRVPGSLNPDGSVYNPLADFDTQANQEPTGRDTAPVTSADPVYDTAAKIGSLENAGWTFVRSNPNIAGGAGDLYDIGQETYDLLAWLDTQDWTDPSSWEGRQAPDGTVVVPPPEVTQPTTPASTQNDGNIFTDILGGFNDGYDFVLDSLPNIFSDSTAQPTAPFVPTTTTPTTAPSNGSSGANQGATGGDTGVDLGNEDVPASDVVAGGQDSTLDDSNNTNLLWLLGGLGAGQLASQQQQQQIAQQESPTRTTDALFRDRLKFKTPNPGLLTPLYRS